MTKILNPEWIQWIHTNVDAGRDKDGIFKILLDEGYAYETIQRQMNYKPSVPLERLANPFAQAARRLSPRCTVRLWI